MRTLTLCVLLALAAPAAADTLKVPAQFDTIALALASAKDGDTILVAKGVYPEPVQVSVPNLKLVGKKAVIDAGYSSDCIDVVVDGVTISGFTLVDGVRGVDVSGSGSTVTGCLITGCQEEGIRVMGGATTISNNTVTHGGGNYGVRYVRTAPGHAQIDRNVVRGGKFVGLYARGDDLAITRNRCVDNPGDGCWVSAESLATDGQDLAVIVDLNDFSDNGGDGLRLTDTTAAPITVRDNECSDNLSGGMIVTASVVTVEGNRCESTRSEFGLLLNIDHGTVSGNTASGNQGFGFCITDAVSSSTGATGDLNVVSGNSAIGNGGDGFRLQSGSSNTFTDNKATGNGDDGLDIDAMACNDTLVDGNTFSGNGHEGLDNGGTGTVITNNACHKNRCGFGPDIAGKGEEGEGTISMFAGNSFATGGAGAIAELDGYDHSNP